MSGPATRACPMCGVSDASSQLSLRREGTQFEIVRCARCQFVFVANPQGETFEPVQAEPPTVPQRPRHRQIKRICDRLLSPTAAKRHIVEIGAGWGGLAQAFAADGAYRYVGFEPSAGRAAFCHAHGFDVRPEQFRGPGSIDGAADAVVIDNVLEHVIDPGELTKSAVAALRAGGLLIVIVPNVRDVRQLQRRWRNRHHWQPHCHINYFSAGDLARLFERNGLQLRFFGLRALGALRDDFPFMPRMLADAIGLHVLGLNVYAIKRGHGA